MAEVSEECCIKDLSVAGAMREVLQVYLSHGNLMTINVTIKSTKACIPTDQWFYLKVSADSCLTEAAFVAGDGFGHLMEVLRELHEFEDESHLCIQYRDADQTSKCVEKNLKLTDEKLEVVHTEYRKKISNISSVHLRVYQRMGHMLQECQKVYQLLLLIRLFHLQLNMKFTLKIDGTVCHSDFSTVESVNIGLKSYRMVADTNYFLHQSGLTALCPRVINTQYQGPVYCDVKMKDSQILSVTLSCVATCCPIKQNQTNRRNSTLSLTVFGPGQIPLQLTDNFLSTVNPLQSQQLYTQDDVGLNLITDLKQKGDFTEVLPCHWQVEVSTGDDLSDVSQFLLPVIILIDIQDSSLSDGDKIHREAESVMTQLLPRIVPLIQSVINLIVKSITAKDKRRSLVRTCMQTVTTAIVDVIAGSVDEQFRQSCFQAINVCSTVEMKERLIQEMSHLNISGGLNTKYIPCQRLTSYQHLQKGGSRTHQDEREVTQNVVDRGHDDRVSTEQQPGQYQNMGGSNKISSSTTSNQDKQRLDGTALIGNTKDTFNLNPMDPMQDVCVPVSQSKAKLNSSLNNSQQSSNTDLDSHVMASPQTPPTVTFVSRKEVSPFHELMICEEDASVSAVNVPVFDEDHKLREDQVDLQSESVWNEIKNSESPDFVGLQTIAELSMFEDQPPVSVCSRDVNSVDVMDEYKEQCDHKPSLHTLHTATDFDHLGYTDEISLTCWDRQDGHHEDIENQHSSVLVGSNRNMCPSASVKDVCEGFEPCTDSVSADIHTGRCHSENMYRQSDTKVVQGQTWHSGYQGHGTDEETHHLVDTNTEAGDWFDQVLNDVHLWLED